MAIQKELKREELHLFQRVGKMRAHHQIIFSIIIFFSLVSMWWGATGILNFLFPGQMLWSYLFALITGFVILAATHYLAKEFMISR
ncbi:MAG: hypothetical protein AABX37_01035 [Nanoarchaeota archaeon]